MIKPAVIPKTLDDILKVQDKARNEVDCFQIDIVDGVYASPKSWPFTSLIGDVKDIRPMMNVPFEVDMMVENPIKEINFWSVMGAKRLIIHYGSFNGKPDNEIITCIKEIKESKCEVYVAFTINDDLSSVSVSSLDVDGVQCMGISRIGVQGEPFNIQALDLIKAIRDKNPDLPISVDGGISVENVCSVIKAGASSVVSGSALLKGEKDFKENIQKFREVISSCVYNK
ncbi:MAG: tryptophan synthase subunit alpha [Candidatus Campbellbacteria bacterium]|nr:tryptophan synthase subunit alpha [Candidatus Campbellbacteria bacterium]